MIDKSKRKATIERTGNMVVVRMTGGPDCLWLSMYLDTADWQMTCDSDIGSYAYHWGKQTASNNHHDFIGFCTEWLSNEEWLLRKCVDEKHLEKEVDLSASGKELRKMMLEYGADDREMDRLDDVLDEAACCSDRREWCAVIRRADECGDIELPEEWWSCIAENYTPWQKRFAEICREVIVPALLPLQTENGGADNVT